MFKLVSIFVISLVSTMSYAGMCSIKISHLATTINKTTIQDKDNTILELESLSECISSAQNLIGVRMKLESDLMLNKKSGIYNINAVSYQYEDDKIESEGIIKSEK